MSTTERYHPVLEWANFRAFLAFVLGVCIGLILAWLICGLKIACVFTEWVALFAFIVGLGLGVFVGRLLSGLE